MSASNAAATAATPTANHNPTLTLDSNSKPNTRRRAILSVEKISNIEMIAGGGINGVLDEKDLSHTIRGETVLERSRDLKKGLVTSSTVSPRRRKHLPKPEKPKWLTALSILTKNCLLLAVLLWMGQMMWKWTERIGDNTSSPFVGLDYEVRIAEIETSLNKAAKMLQVQLEVIDKKIGNEIGIVTNELRLVEDKGTMFEEELKKLVARTDDLDKSLGELKDMGLLPKKEIESFWNEWKNSGSHDGSSKDVSLDHIRVLARDIVEKEIEKHAADGLGRVDYALASGGARVVRHSEPYVFGKGNGLFSVAKGRNGVHANAQKMLEPSFGEPGQCFPLKGRSGFVEIRLKTGIILEAVTLEHVSKSVAYDRSSAPRDCQVSAWFKVPGGDNPSNGTGKMLRLAEFSYDLEKSNAQTFDVKSADPGVINMVRFDFTSNHGSSALTCIYRFRVHGYEPSSAAAMAMEA